MTMIQDYHYGNQHDPDFEQFLEEPECQHEHDQEEGSYEPHDMSQKMETFLTGYDNLAELLVIKAEIHNYLDHYNEADEREGPDEDDPDTDPDFLYEFHTNRQRDLDQHFNMLQHLFRRLVEHEPENEEAWQALEILQQHHAEGHGDDDDEGGYEEENKGDYGDGNEDDYGENDYYDYQDEDEDEDQDEGNFSQYSHEDNGEFSHHNSDLEYAENDENGGYHDRHNAGYGDHYNYDPNQKDTYYHDYSS